MQRDTHNKHTYLELSGVAVRAEISFVSGHGFKSRRIVHRLFDKLGLLSSKVARSIGLLLQQQQHHMKETTTKKLKCVILIYKRLFYEFF